MSIEQIETAIRKLRSEDPLIEAPNFCRVAAEKMKKVAEEANTEEPKAKINYLVWPENSDSEEIHYAVVASDKHRSIVFNPNPTPGFPEYQGPLETAPGLISEMKVADRVLYQKAS